jgi:hypothetical protein
MADNITVQVKGLAELKAKFDAMKFNLNKYMVAAGKEAGNNLLDTEGLRKYPPETSANMPPTPYYIRGVGMQYKYGNNGKSEKLGSQYHIDAVPYGARIYNMASYAKHVSGEEGDQSKAMAAKGWKQLYGTAMEKLDMITRVFTAWVEKALKDSGLKG